MPIIASQLVAAVSTTGSEEANAKLDSVGKKSDDLQKKLGNDLKMGAFLAGGALIAAGVSAVHMAGDFEAGITSIITGAGEFEKNRQMISDGVLKMSVDVGTSTKQLTDGLYMIESAGFHGAAGLDVLKAAAEGAKVGNADLGTVADGVTTIMVDYAKAHVTASQATNILVATVAAGKTHMGDLAAAMASVLPTASAVKVHINDVAGAMATMTAEGTPAADAATYLRQMLLALEVPGGKAVKTFKEIGLSASDVASEMQKSLPGALEMIIDHLKKKFPEGSAEYTAALKDMAGGQKNFQAWLELTGTHLSAFGDNVTQISDKVKEGGKNITGWTDVQKDFNFKLDQTHAMFDQLLIKVGQQLMPVVSEFMTKYVQPLIQNFLDWTNHGNNLHDMFQNVTNVLGPLLTDTGKFVGFLASGSPGAIAMRDALMGIGVAFALIKIKDLISDFKSMITDTLPQVIEKLTGIGTTAKITMARDVASGAKAAEDSIGGIGTKATDTEGDVKHASTGMKGALSDVVGSLGTAIGLATIFAQIASAMGVNNVGMIQGVNPQLTAADGVGLNNHFGIGSGTSIPFITGLANWLALLQQNGLPNLFAGIGGHASGITNNPVGHWAMVGEQGPEPMYVPAGASIFPHGSTIPSGGSGSSQPLYLTINIAGQNVGQVLLPDIASALRLGNGLVGV